MVRTLDSESSNPSSNLGGTLFFSMFLVLYIEGKDVITHNQPQRARVLALPLPLTTSTLPSPPITATNFYHTELLKQKHLSIHHSAIEIHENGFLIIQ